MSRRRRSRKIKLSPFYDPLKDFLGGGERGARIAGYLLEAGIRTQEEIAQAAYVDLRNLTGRGLQKADFRYLSAVRLQLRSRYGPVQ